jgi:hypothetical protein
MMPLMWSSSKWEMNTMSSPPDPGRVVLCKYASSSRSMNRSLLDVPQSYTYVAAGAGVFESGSKIAPEWKKP